MIFLIFGSSANPGHDPEIEYPDQEPDQNPGHYVDRSIFCNSICRKNTNISQNIEEIIDEKVIDLKHSITERFETITGLVYVIKRDVQRLAKNNVADKPANVTIDSKGNTTLDVMGNIPKLEEYINNLLNISEKIQVSVAETNQILNILKNNVSEPGKCDLGQNINESNDKNILEKITSISNKITDPDYKEKTILKSIDNIINNRFTAMKNDLQNSINERLAILENIPNLEQQIQNILNITQKIQTSVATTNQGSNTSEKNSTESGNASCEVRVPSSIHIKSDIWQHKQVPAEDELDRFMVNKTGRTDIF